MRVDIREEASEDHRGIHHLLVEAFERENEAGLVDKLRKSPAYIPELSLVALVDGGLAGHILFTKNRIINEDGSQFESLSLAPLAVGAAFQKKGIGKQLISAGLTRAKVLGYSSVMVLGYEHYYEKFGFLPADTWHIVPPFKVPANVCMALELSPQSLRHISGTVIFPKEFDQV
jgi:putative acetyltransferase